MKIYQNVLIVLSVLFFVTWTVCSFLFAANWRCGFLFLISGLIGFVFKYNSFGFTCSFRSMLSNGDFLQMRDVIAVLTVSTILINVFQINDWVGNPLFYPEKTDFRTSNYPVGLSLVLGALFFGMGMQLGSGCATGTLVGMGEGSLKSWIVIWFFIMGATIGATNPFYRWWSKLPKTDVITIDWGFIFLILMVICALAYLGDFIRVRVNSKDKNEFHNTMLNNELLMAVDADSEAEIEPPKLRFVFFDVKNFVFDCIIGVLVALFFLCDGQTIGVMGVFPLIGGQFLKWCGCDVDNWDYYKNSPIPSNIMKNDMFLSDVFIILGAFLAAAITNKFGQLKPWPEYIEGIFGGLLMGLGGRMSGGCNIGSMLSGINSCSIHGFLWMFSAILGSGVVIFAKKFYLKIRQKFS